MTKKILKHIAIDLVIHACFVHTFGKEVSKNHQANRRAWSLQSND